MKYLCDQTDLNQISRWPPASYDIYYLCAYQRLFNNLLRKMRSAQEISTHKSLVVKLVKVRFRGHDAKKRIPFFRPYSGN